MKLALAIAIAWLSAMGTGCAGVDPEAETLAENGSDVGDLAARVTALTASFALGAGSTVDLTTIAATATLYAPEGCVTTRLTAADGVESLILTFADCAGPWGLVHVTGEVTVGPPPGNPIPGTLEVGSTDLKLDRATVTFKAEASIRSTGPAGRVLSWAPAISGETARGRAFQSEGSWSVSWTVGGTCIEADTSGDQAVVAGSALVIEQALDLTRCSATCPTAGRLVLTGTSSLRETLSFDGGDIAAFVTSSGTNDIQLACGL